jgi:hypothetical protein
MHTKMHSSRRVFTLVPRPSYIGSTSFLSPPPLTSSNHEVRLKEKDSTFVPNVGNLCPRPKNWTAVEFENYGAK